MKTFYKSHTIEVNAQPNGQIVFDIFRGQHHVLAGFSGTGTEREFVDYSKARVDQLIQDAPAVFRGF